tara:strand:+ start:264 stop:431 length:168 start_codon:yes stop_codon:yes gene_type:complete
LQQRLLRIDGCIRCRHLLWREDASQHEETVEVKEETLVRGDASSLAGGFHADVSR